MDVVSPPAAIEGAKVDGQSRKPLKSRGLVRVNGTECDKFSADFDVRAKVVETATTATLVPDASLSVSDEVVSAKAVVYSLDDKPKCKVTTGSATHKTNAWHFSNQTAVQVTEAHEQIRNALEKRARDAQLPAGKK